jgi:hypothetical protein
MNSTNAPHGEELGLMNPFFCSLASSFFNSANSFAGIRYNLLEIRAILAYRVDPRETHLESHELP